MKGIRYPADQALQVAVDILTVLKPVCHRITIAGSLRRHKPFVGDIEILYIPKMEDIADPADLFKNPIPTNLVDRTLKRWKDANVLAPRLKEDGPLTWGSLIKLSTHVRSGIPVDFFAATKNNWWSLLVCRTGPAESNMQICIAANQWGWTWDPYEGFKDRRTGKLIRTPGSEADVFKAVNLPNLPPNKREHLTDIVNKL